MVAGSWPKEHFLKVKETMYIQRVDIFACLDPAIDADLSMNTAVYTHISKINHFLIAAQIAFNDINMRLTDFTLRDEFTTAVKKSL